MPCFCGTSGTPNLKYLLYFFCGPAEFVPVGIFGAARFRLSGSVCVGLCGAVCFARVLGSRQECGRSFFTALRSLGIYIVLLLPYISTLGHHWRVDVLHVSLSRTCCLIVCCRSRGERGRGSCWLFESGACEVAFSELSSAEVSQVMSLVRSLLSLLDLSGWK